MKRTKMPPRKEPKEQVVYAASKRKAPPFKPQRPSQVPRIPTTESESSRAPAPKKPAAPAKRKPAAPKIVEESDEGDVSTLQGDEDKQSDDDLDDNPRAARATKASKIFKPPATKRRPTREPSPMDISSDDDAAPPSRPQSADADYPPAPTQSEQPVIPQPLLIRLLHEHFADSETKIDKHAIQVLEKYFEIFFAETVARAKLQKQEDAARKGEHGGVDAGWLELEDLEKVAAGMMLDF